MSRPDSQSLQAIQEQLASVLEARVTELMTEVKASQVLSRQIARTEEELDRQRMLRERLHAELGPLRDEATALDAETKLLQEEVDGLLDNISRMRNLREELRAIKGESDVPAET